MPAGIQIFNDAGTIQIDSTWSNYALVDKRTILSARAGWGGNDVSGAVHSTSSPGDIVFASSPGEILPIGLSQSSGVRSYRVGTGTAQGVPVEFLTFRRQPPRDSLFGMQVFDENGVLIFDAVDKRCRIAGVLPAAQLNFPGSFPFPAGRKYAVLCPSFTGQLVQQDTGGGTGNMGFRYFITNSPALLLGSAGITSQGYKVSSVYQVPIQNPSGGVVVNNYVGRDYLVADVTDY